ncbi:ribonuclease J [Fructilactobacillus fructivorans]|uniref:ribonuclease J n=1 Tax=Fructilactobacillus fructivorans TaxID=1614 RepID=UPI000705335D|nr:ribonuclease J [Fructilactobacillus fructivorans]KRN39603.1 beta-lactamase domain-containing protein [Fructilactobacillus fructivorans]KRN43323.1 beta-lactamase domain-containing protein [Fructilactobacillus fructivorans]
MKNNIKIIPLGGVRENGKDLYAIEINDNSIFILDCGLKYPQNEMLGIDFVIPDFSYLRDNADKIVGVFLTHGHADAIGALPYFLSEFNVPVFGTELTIGLAKLAVADNKKTKKFNDFHVINSKSEIVFEDGTVSFFDTTHSIPDSVGIVISTELGNIVYTGDFKFDQTAADGYKTDYAALADIGKEHVLALLSDSRNADNPEESTDEKEIRDYLYETFHYQKGRVIVACLANNILRIQEVLNAAAKAGRRVYLTSKGLEEVIDTALKLGKLTLPSDDLFIKSAKEMEKMDPHNIIILQTGKNGEPMELLQRMADNRDRDVDIQPGDLVLIATSPSRAMDTPWAKTRDMIYKAGGEVMSIADEKNISGDASKHDLQLLLNLIHPDYLIPIQGEYRLMEAQKELAEEVGMKPSHIILPAKGDVIEFDGENMFLSEAVPASDTMIDGIGVGDIGNIVLRDRKVLSEDGVFVAVVTIDRKKKKIISEPKIMARGFVYVNSDKSLLGEAAEIVTKAVQNNLDNKEFDWGHLKQDVREDLGQFLYKKTGRRPVILPVIMEANQHHRRKKSNNKNDQEDN